MALEGLIAGELLGPAGGDRTTQSGPDRIGRLGQDASPLVHRWSTILGRR